MCVKFQLSSSNTFRDMRGSQILRWGVKFSLKLVPYFGVKVHALIEIDRGGSLIVCDGGDCQCEVLFQSYSPSNVELGLQNDNFWGVLGDFSMGGRYLLPLGYIIKLHPYRILCESMNEMRSATLEITF